MPVPNLLLPCLCHVCYCRTCAKPITAVAVPNLLLPYLYQTCYCCTCTTSVLSLHYPLHSKGQSPTFIIIIIIIIIIIVFYLFSPVSCLSGGGLPVRPDRNQASKPLPQHGTYGQCLLPLLMILYVLPYFSIDNAHLMYNAHPKLFRHSF